MLAMRMAQGALFGALLAAMALGLAHEAQAYNWSTVTVDSMGANGDRMMSYRGDWPNFDIKFAISSSTGESRTATDQGVTTCTGTTVVASNCIDPNTQVQKRHFDGRPEITNLTTPNQMQRIITLGGEQAQAASFTVHFIDVGQGDAMLIESGDATILVDGGQAWADVESYLQAQGVDDIDLMVATHPHADHIGGLIDVIGLFDVHEVWTNGETHTSQTYQNFAAAVAAEGAMDRDVARGYSTQMGALEIDVLHPVTPLTGDLNENSVVLQVSCGQVDVLLTGDATMDSEASMLAAGLLGDVEVLKVGHHGSNTSTSTAFLDATTPEDAVISVGAGNSYGHPHPDTLARLAAAGVTSYRTDQDGTIVLTSDCTAYSLATGGDILVGGIAKYPNVAAPGGGSGIPVGTHALLTGLAAVALVITISGAWYVKRKSG
jgi:competence protein ComEC